MPLNASKRVREAILRNSALLLLLAACSSKPPSGFTVFVTADAQPAINSFFEFLPEAAALVTTSTDPAGEVKANHGSGVRVALVTDLTCGECYQLSGSQWSYQVHGGNTLALQYGLAELLEAFNFRFFHPWGVKAPATLASPDSSGAFGKMFTPQMSLRGLHLHTLHPIESYYAFWSPDASMANDARRIVDWVIKNRGNYIEWSALDNIVPPGATQDAWHTQTAAIIAEAHQRGIRIGIGTELFGTGNLQQSFDLLDNVPDTNAQADINARLHILLDGLAWDVVDLSFGEFAATDPNLFIDSVNQSYAGLQQIAPGTELAATIHMDNSPGLQINYMGQTLPYYFLVQFADPHIVPWIHSVMYYDLFQSAGGAYGYEMFAQHLAYLQNRLTANQPVAYYPESAYWVAFDDSVPTYLPVYMHSRWTDMKQLPGLQQHVLFSTGWEWGYWQNDYATLRMNFSLPTDWSAPVQQMFAPWGAQGQALAQQIKALGELQSQALIDQQLGPYLAGRDSLVDSGAKAGIISQPPRVQFADILTMLADARTQFVQSVVTPLATLQASTEQIQSSVNSLSLDPQDPWLSETLDGFAIDVARTQYMAALYQGVVAFASTGSDAGWLAKADAALANAQTIIQRRHAHLHYPSPSLLLESTVNATLYQYGYLMEADTLCYWQRERGQARKLVLGEAFTDPGCVL